MGQCTDWLGGTICVLGCNVWGMDGKKGDNGSGDKKVE